ncbi:MAG: B12-binding domain-containing radical SAM protein [Chloroflexota bacterium]
MKILLVYPSYPDTFWSFSHALKFVAKKASFPPLGLLTVAAMLPAKWAKKLVDMNVERLSDRDLRWADYVFISAMVVQKDSAKEVITRARELGVKVVAGGPLFTTSHQEFTGVDHFVLGEAEVTLPQFLADLAAGCPKPIYYSRERPDISATPIPQWSLLPSMKNYSSMAIQYSRGCPFNCEFCDIVVLNGREPRTKGREQVLAELESLYKHGWRGGVFIVDDNFIGNKNRVKTEILPAIVAWSKERGYPFVYSTEASINMADDDELMRLMVEAGFNTVFIGIETPNEASLAECGKGQNQNRELVDSVRKIQNCGLEVQGGFIVGFDHDPVSIFKSQINFIQKSGIVTAMVGLLQALPETRLYQRLKGEKRLVENATGNNTDCSLNFIPKMSHETLINGYRHILDTIYAPKQYYERVRTFLKVYRPRYHGRPRLGMHQVRALFQSMWVLGLKEKERVYYWKLFFAGIFRHPRAFPLSITLAIYGYHFRKVVERYLVDKPGETSYEVVRRD